jgi:glutathione S-transferase
MLTLRHSPSSPFVRKIKIAASVLGLEREIAIAPADTMSPSDSLRQQNPLGKVPALLLDDGTVLFDSRVILEYLDHRAGGGRIIPKEAGARFAALRLQALADGIMDASVLLVYEGRWRPPERHEPKWVELQNGKVARALATLEAASLPAPVATPDVGQIALAVRSATATSVSPGAGARIIRGSSPGSTTSPAACRLSRRPRRRRPEPGCMRRSTQNANPRTIGPGVCPRRSAVRIRTGR